MQHPVFVGLGSNQGEKLQHCQAAVREILSLEGSTLLAQSSWYLTEPWGKEDQDWFVNGVIQIRTGLNPSDLLVRFQGIERRLNRVPTMHWGPRVIDIDILFYDQIKVKTPALEIPHPQLHRRNFVLIPMAEIAPQFVHPVFQVSIQKLLSQVSDPKGVSRLS